MDSALFILISWFVVAFGACVGSFLNVVVWRLPRGESLVHPGSHCPKCGESLRPWDNIPVLAWLLLRGRCRYCRAPISARYPIVESITAAAYWIIWCRLWSTGATLDTGLAFFYLTAALIAISIIDWECMIIPDELTFTGMGLAVAIAALQPHRLLMGEAPVTSTSTPSILTDLLAEAVARIFPIVAGPRGNALLQSVAGMLVGGGIIWFFVEFGKLLWGHATGSDPSGRTISLDAQGLELEGFGDLPWEDICFRKRDELRLEITGITRLELADDSVTNLPEGPLTLAVRDQNVSLAGQTYPLQHLQKLTGIAVRWKIPREAMGFGDVKLMAMLGGFLWMDAALFILMAGSILGCTVGVVLACTRQKQNHGHIPFGPFLAAGAFVWLLAGPELVGLYGRFLQRLILNM